MGSMSWLVRTALRLLLSKLFDLLLDRAIGEDE